MLRRNVDVMTAELKTPKPLEFYRIIRRIVRQELRSIGPVAVAPSGSVGIGKGKIPASHTGSANPKIQQPHESSTTLGSKTYKVGQAIGNRFAALAASDPIAYWYDADGNKQPLNKIVDNGSTVTDAEYLMGLSPVAPGNTLIRSTDAEASTGSASYVMVKEFFDARPGKFRVKFELSRTGGTTQVILRLRYPDGTYFDASGLETYSGAVYPDFSTTKTLDMTIEQWWGGTTIAVFLLNDSGPAQTAYIQNCRLYYANATAVLTPHGAVLLD